MTHPENNLRANHNYKKESIENKASLDLLTTLFGESDTNKIIDKVDDLAEARKLVANYFALGKVQGENLKKMLEANVGFKSFSAASSISGSSGGVIANFIDPSAIATSAGVTMGSFFGPVGALVGLGAAKTITAIPGVTTATHAVIGGLSGLLIGSAIYLLAATKTKWVNIKKFEAYMQYDLFAWENQHFRQQSILIQGAVEILTQYLRSKVTGKFRKLKLLQISWQDSDKGFYLINSYVKILLILMLSVDKMPSSIILSILKYIEAELYSEEIGKDIPYDFKQVFLNFREKITKYVESRVYSEAVVENIGNTIVSACSAITPIMPWIYSSLTGNDQGVKFYDSEAFIQKIETDTLSSASYKFWTDLSILRVNEIKETKALRLESIEKRISKVNALIHDLNNIQANFKNIDYLPGDNSLAKVDKKVNKLFEYAHDFLKYNFNNKDKELEKIITLTHKLVKLEVYNLKSPSYSNKIWDKMFNWWNYQHKNTEKNGALNSKLYSGIVKINSEQKILSQEEFKNVVNICFEIKNEFDKNKKLKEKYSQSFLQGQENKRREFVFAIKIDSFCELVNYVERLSQFMEKDDKSDKFSVYSFFGLWSLYNIILSKYSSDIPSELIRNIQDKKLANNYNSDDRLKRYFLIPYDSFTKFLIPGFQREYLNKNSTDFFRMYIFYLSNIINLISEIQYHTEALKFSKLILAMFGEENTPVFFALSPLHILKDRIILLQNMMQEFYNHVISLQNNYTNEKQSSWSNMVGLYDFLFGKNTGFYQNFIERYEEYTSRLIIFKRNIEYSISLLEQKCKTSNFEGKPINEGIARNTDLYFNYSLDLFLNYLKGVNLNYKDNSYSDKLELQIMELKEKHESFINDKALMIGVIPNFNFTKSVLNNQENEEINNFIMEFYNLKNYKIPNKIFEISKNSTDYRKISFILQNFLNSVESSEILQACILKVRESSRFKSFGYHFYKKSSLFDITRNDIFLEDAPVRTGLFMQYFSALEKNSKIQLISNNLDDHVSENLLKESGLSEIDLDFPDNESSTKNHAALVYLLVFSCAQYPANKETILNEFYSNSNTEKEKLSFIYSVWGLYGLFLAYMFDGTREKYAKIIAMYQQEKFNRKVEEAQLTSIRDKTIAAEKKKILQEKIAYKEQITLEKNAISQAQTSIYAKVALGVQMEIKRLENTEKGRILKAEFEKIDRENSINLINKLSKVLTKHRSYIAFGTPQSYQNILSLAEKNGITKADILQANGKS